MTCTAGTDRATTLSRSPSESPRKTREADVKTRDGVLARKDWLAKVKPLTEISI